MKRYIDADKLKEYLADRYEVCPISDDERHGRHCAIIEIQNFITPLQQEQQTDKQVVVITESHGDANIEWDCRSLGDVIALLKSAESFISDKRVEELRGPGCGPDYDTMEGRYSKPRNSQQEQPECSSSLVDVDAVRENFMAEVYHILDADSTNDRANAIINAFDSLPTVSQEQPEQSEEYGPYARQYPKSKVSQEQPEVDLEKEIDRFWDSCIKHKNERGGNVIWSNKIEIEVLAHHFYELGRNTKKQ